MMRADWTKPTAESIEGAGLHDMFLIFAPSGVHRA